MSEPKDLAIKLFGKTISLPEISATCNEDYVNNDKRFDQNHGHCCYKNGEETEDEKDVVVDKRIVSGDRKEDRIRSKQCDTAPLVASEEFTNSEATNGASDKRNGLSVEKESMASETCKIDEDRSETSNPEEKTVKKSNKVLPCPRCNSMDTKFCYYNNYNVSQPRHFCKNCQRYWTAGGAMRNVPVGAGRRKSKNSSSHCRHAVGSEPLRNARNDETMCNPTQNRIHKPEVLNIHVSYRGGKNRKVCSNGSSVPNSNDEASKAGSHDQTMPSCRSFPPHMPCFPGFFLPYSLNSARWSSPFCPSMPFYPTASYWGCSIPTTWNVPWLPQPSSDTQIVPSSCSNSPSLGKHSRDESMVKPSNTGEDEPVNKNDGDRCLWLPKTLRINDPAEASKNEKSDSIGDGRLFNGFRSKGDERNRVLETSPILQANPAALSRSINFHESS